MKSASHLSGCTCLQQGIKRDILLPYLVFISMRGKKKNLKTTRLEHSLVDERHHHRLEPAPLLTKELEHFRSSKSHFHSQSVSNIVLIIPEQQADLYFVVRRRSLCLQLFAKRRCCSLPDALVAGSAIESRAICFDQRESCHDAAKFTHVKKLRLSLPTPVECRSGLELWNTQPHSA